MELRALRAFVAVAEELNFRRAASRLQLAPASVTAAVQRLERVLGVALLDRNSRGVRVTDAGRSLLPAIRHVLAGADHVRTLARQVGEPHEIAVGTLFGFGAAAVEEAATTLRREGFDYQVELRVFGWEDPTGGLAGNEVDAAVVAGPSVRDGELHRRRLWDEQRVAVLPAGHPLTARPEVVLADIDALGWIRIQAGDPVWSRYWRLDDVRGHPPTEVGRVFTSPHEMLLAIRNGHGTCTTLSSYRDQFNLDRFALVPVVDVPPVAVDFVYRRTGATPALRHFAETVARTARRTRATLPP